MVVLKAERYWPDGQLGWATHDPLLVADWPDRYCPAGHSPCLAHERPLVRPPHEPDWNSPLAHFVLLQDSHWKPLVVPLHEPVWNICDGHGLFPHALHVNPSVVPEHAPLR